MRAAEMDNSAKSFDPMLLEAALYHPRNACKAQPDHEEQGPNTLTKPDENGRIIEEQQEGPDTGSPSQTPAGESDEGADTKGSGGEKKRKKRAKNWGDEETMILLKAVSQKKKTKSRFNQGCATELSYWDSIAKKVRDRTGDECRRRMETLIKSYKTIERYCDQKKKEFTELSAEDFEVMKPKLATRITESWYNHIRDQCAPRSGKKMMRDQGVGSPFANADLVVCASTSGGVGSLPAGIQNPVAESMQLVMATTPVSAIQSKRALEAFGVEMQLPQTPINADAQQVAASDRPPAAVDEASHLAKSSELPVRGEGLPDPGDDDDVLQYLNLEQYTDPVHVPWVPMESDPVTWLFDFTLDFQDSDLMLH